MTAPAPDRGLESWDKRLETLGRIGPYVLLLDLDADRWCWRGRGRTSGSPSGWLPAPRPG